MRYLIDPFESPVAMQELTAEKTMGVKLAPGGFNDASRDIFQ